MVTIQQILRSKGHEVIRIQPEVKVFEALKIMSDNNIGALMVMRGNDLQGIFSERDYARKVILEGKSSKDLSVEDIMTNKVVYLRPDQTAQECMEMMTQNRIRHLPVFEDGNLMGVISIGDIVKAVISDQENMIQQLEHYIAGV